MNLSHLINSSSIPGRPGLDRVLPFRSVGWILAIAFLGVATRPCAADAVWNKAAGGGWMEATSWLGGLPSSTQAVSIVNAGSKVVTIDAAAPAANRIVRRLSIGGALGATNTLRLSNLGQQALSSSNTVSLAAGSRLEVLNSRLVIDGAAQGSLTVLAGDLLLDGGEIAAVAGARTRVGREGLGTMTLRSGLFRNESDLILGGLGGSVGRLTMDGGTSIVSGILILGDDPLARGEFLMRGGTLIATNSTARIGDDGSGSLTLSNGLAMLEDVSVGRSSNSAGVLMLSGGALRCKDLSVGRFGSSTGLFVLKGGSLQAPLDAIYVGREGAGEMQVESGDARILDLQVTVAASARGRLSMSGGSLAVASNLTVGVVAGKGAEALILGGNLAVTNSDHTARLQVGIGSLQIQGGSVVVDHLVLANAQGTMLFNGGRLVSRQTQVSNGKAFVVGDGVQSATLHLDGGVHQFPNGLVISSKSSLTGCGTVVGVITVRPGGANLLRCGGPELVQFQRTAQGIGFAFVGTAGVSYAVEYTDQLVPPVWKPLRAVVGTGALSSVQDSILPGGRRFYRLSSSQP